MHYIVWERTDWMFHCLRGTIEHKAVWKGNSHSIVWERNNLIPHFLGQELLRTDFLQCGTLFYLKVSFQVIYLFGKRAQLPWATMLVMICRPRTAPSPYSTSVTFHERWSAGFDFILATPSDSASVRKHIPKSSSGCQEVVLPTFTANTWPLLSLSLSTAVLHR